jgi:hypothetical protein
MQNYLQTKNLTMISMIHLEGGNYDGLQKCRQLVHRQPRWCAFATRTVPR